MIYPRDVHSVIQNQRKIVGQNKNQLIFVLFVIGNIIGFFVLQNVLMMFNVNKLRYVLLIQFCIMLIVGIFVFRFGIFKESEKKEEVKNANSDSFARYLYLRKDVDNSVSIMNNRVNVFEFSNGTATCTFAFRYGTNDNLRSKNTREMFEKVISRAAFHNFEIRVVVDSEDFRTSKEFHRHIEQINAIQDVELRKHMMSITNNVIDLSLQKANVDIVYITIRALSNYQKADLELLLRELLVAFTENSTAIRSIYSLNRDQLLEFYRNFYKIEAIDLTMMKAIELSQDIDASFSHVVKLIELKSDSGKVFKTNEDLDKLFSIHERSI